MELAQYNDLIEFLCILETEAVSLAASRVQKDQLAEIEKYKNLCDQYRYNQGAIQEYNDQFHLQIRMASNNKLIVSALSASYEQFNRNIIRTLIQTDNKEFMDQCIEEHSQLFEAIKNGDSRRAKGIAYDHLQHDVRRLKEL